MRKLGNSREAIFRNEELLKERWEKTAVMQKEVKDKG
jgi:hypothetical protein